MCFYLIAQTAVLFADQFQKNRMFLLSYEKIGLLNNSIYEPGGVFGNSVIYMDSVSNFTE